MGDVADRFRMRARQCRLLGQQAKDAQQRKMLNKMAAELDQEADLIDGEEQRNQSHSDASDPSTRKPTP